MRWMLKLQGYLFVILMTGRELKFLLDSILNQQVLEPLFWKASAFYKQKICYLNLAYFYSIQDICIVTMIISVMMHHILMTSFNDVSFITMLLTICISILQMEHGLEEGSCSICGMICHSPHTKQVWLHHSVLHILHIQCSLSSANLSEAPLWSPGKRKKNLRNENHTKCKFQIQAMVMGKL